MFHPIVRYPAGVLTGVAEPVAEFDESLLALAKDLERTCLEYDGVGLAAPQIGVNKRVALIYPRGNAPYVLVNPTWRPAPVSTSMVVEEGCLSLPGLLVDIERLDRIEVQALTVNREPLEFTAEGLQARIIQHEIDHLEGRLIVDHLTPTKRSLVLHAFRKNLKKTTRRFHDAVRHGGVSLRKTA
ncbi:peptide deformylase [archaeon]|nr:MAG: peptide deformylase [archaeon]